MEPQDETNTQVLGKKEIQINGVDLVLDLTMVDDVDALYKIRDAQKGDLFAALDLIDLLLGEEQREKLVASVRDRETRRASVSDYADILERLLTAIPK